MAKTVGTQAGRLWLAHRSAEDDRYKDLTELIRVNFRDGISRRKVEHQIDGIALAVMERLQPLCEGELRGLQEEDKASVIAEVTEALREADLSDAVVLGADADAVKLARDVRARIPRRDLSFELGEAGARLFDVLLMECCDCLVRIVMELPQFGPRATAETLTRLSGLSDQVAMVLARMPPRSLDAPEGADDDEEFGRRYAEHISRVLDHVELFGVRVRRYRPQTSLSVAYISLSVSGDGLRRTSTPGMDRLAGHLSLAGERWDEAEHGSNATVRVETALGDKHRTLIRGEAGSGKSTLLRWLAITAVREGFDADLAGWNGCMPFLVKLRSHADGDLPRPEDFLNGTADALTGLMPRGWVHRRLKSGKALLLVDGVDELPGSQRRKVPGWLRDLLSAFPGVRVVVTSRPAAASARWLAGEGFATAHLEPMAPGDLRALIRQWHQAIGDTEHLPCAVEELPGYEGALLARLESAPHLRALAATPLLAAMLCALNLDHATRLPRDRMGLYAATLEMLLDRRDGERDIPSFQDVDLDYTQKLRILQDLAWRLSTSHRSELPKPVVLRGIEEKLAAMPQVEGTPEAVADHLLQRSGVLREPVDGRIDFVHRTVQEYLTAQQAVYDHDIEYLIDRAHQPGWRETIIMAAGHANGPQLTELLTGILARTTDGSRRARYMKLLAAACLETAPTVPVELRQQVHACVDDLVPPREKNTARSLSTAGDVVLDRLPATLDGLTAAQAAATVHAAALINGPRALRRLVGYRHDPRPGVQRELQRAWTYFDPDEYARRVLVDAPLTDTIVRVATTAQLPFLRHLANIRKLFVEVAPLDDLSFLDDVQGLESIGFYEVPAPDISPLLHHAETLHDISGALFQETASRIFAELPMLRSLNVGFDGLRDINFVDDLPQLEELTIRGLDGVRDFSPISRRQNLVCLWLMDCNHLVDVTLLPLGDQMRELGIYGSRLSCGLADIVAQAPRIERLNIADCPWISDIEPLSRLRLKSLVIGGRVDDIGPLATQHQLAVLILIDSGVEDLTPLSGLLQLEQVNLGRCRNLTDLAPLASLGKLDTLVLTDARPGLDLAPLARRRGVRIRIRAGQDVRNRELVRGSIIEEIP
ncbi:NACHT domain-containing protein [Nocardiopsis sediminis]|uniref:NACHT domain-containing protein n=1 Tax=Nocardiopsis sediminis TaxID=1778267 RepID=A0ABV8FK70_9ACTN